MADPKTVASVGRIPKGGYAAGLATGALRGARLGLHGPGWRDAAPSDETASLYARAQIEISGCGAALVADPFADSGFAAVALGRPAGSRFDWRGLESVPFDLQNYLQRLGPNAALKTFAAFAAATEAQNAFGPTGPLRYLADSPVFQACFARPDLPPDLSDFSAAREAYLAIFDGVMDAQGLDALVFPQMLASSPPLHGEQTIEATTVSEINVAGLPGVVVPAGYYANSAPFCLIFIGRKWSEARLLGLAYDYEQATWHRRAPELGA
jgi:aspartyl-tRNA(Asn)/glutamyl-tRNA(Gln) amidotransferase subunit A